MNNVKSKMSSTSFGEVSVGENKLISAHRLSNGSRVCGKGQVIVFVHGLFFVNLNSNNAFSRTRIVLWPKFPKQKFHNDFHLVSLILDNPGSREPVYMRRHRL